MVMANINEEKLRRYKIRTQRCLELYSKLYELDCNNQSRGEEYQKYLGYLKMMSEYEKESLASLDDTECILLLEHLKQDDNLKDDINIRISNQILNRLTLSRNPKITTIDTSTSDYLSNLLKEKSPEEEDRLTKAFSVFQLYFKRDVYLLALSFLSEQKSTFSPSLHQRLQQQIYEIVKFESSIEPEILASELQIPADLYLVHQMNAELCNLSSSAFTGIKKHASSTLITKVTNAILHTGDINLGDEDALAKVIWNQCLLRACLAIIGKKDKDEEFARFTDFLTTEAGLDLSVTNRMCMMLIKECFASFDNDISRVKKISFGRYNS